MTISKMDHAMLSFGLLGGLLVPRSRTAGERTSAPKPGKPSRRK
ncbi:MAG: hypothetical protein ACOYM5_08820 [Caulobacter sp.]